MEEDKDVKSGLSMLQQHEGEARKRRAKGDECRAKSQTIKASVDCS